MKRQGFVHVREEVRAELPWHRYEAHWQPDPRSSERGGGWNEIEKAIEWARRHAPVVHVRLGAGLTEVYNAGERDDRAGSPRWPGALHGTAVDAHQGYGGMVYVDEEQPTFISAGRYSALWTSEAHRLLGEAEGFEDVETAIDWGRDRAPVVFVAELPLHYSGPPTYPTYEIRSAGEVDPPGDPLERLRPRPGHETMEWEFTMQEPLEGMEADVFSRRLEDALRADGTVRDPECSASDRVSAMSYRVADDAEDGTDEVSSPLLRVGVDISFRVSAPTREQALSVAAQALIRARSQGDGIMLVGHRIRAID